MNDVVIQTNAITKTYESGSNSVHALRGIDLTVHRGEFIAVMGQSGSGKSTLMNVLGCLDTPTSGNYLLDDVHVETLNKNELAAIRNEKIGFVFQAYNLLPRNTAISNVELPLLYAKAADRRRRAREALAIVGLSNRENHRPNQLSGGQQQRVAIARALVTEPSMILADEPTGNLDTASSAEIAGLLSRLHQSGRTVVLITHEEDVANVADRVVRLRDGKIISDTLNRAPAGAPA
jgi:putative ABC transport system ATP-binding protein